MKNNEDYEYHGVAVTITSPEGSGGLQYEEINEIVDAYIKNEKGEFLRKLFINIDENGDIELSPTYSRRAIERIKNLRPRCQSPIPQDIPQDIPQNLPKRNVERVAPWPKTEIRG